MIVYNKLIIKQLLTTCVVDLQLASKRIVICVKLRAEATQVTVVKSVKLPHDLIEIVK